MQFNTCTAAGAHIAGWLASHPAAVIIVFAHPAAMITAGMSVVRRGRLCEGACPPDPDAKPGYDAMPGSKFTDPG